MKKIINYDLKTPEYELLDRVSPLKEYPRMQFKRDSYLSLNGEWDYYISDNPDLKLDFEGKILVPYCLESKNSNVFKSLKKGEYIIYHKSLSIDKSVIFTIPNVILLKQLFVDNLTGLLLDSVIVKLGTITLCG